MSQDNHKKRNGIIALIIILLLLLLLFWFIWFRPKEQKATSPQKDEKISYHEKNINVPSTSKDDNSKSNSSNLDNNSDPKTNLNPPENQDGTSNNESNNNTPSQPENQPQDAPESPVKPEGPTEPTEPTKPEEPEEPENPFDPDELDPEGNYIHEGLTEPEEDVLYMQDVTPADVAAMEQGEMYTVVDKRDGKNYQVTKYTQENGIDALFMLENLALGSSEKPMLLTPNYTDIKDVFILPTSTEMPNDIEDITDFVTMTIPSEDIIAEYAIENGYLYSPLTAIANHLDETANEFYQYYNAEESICPKGWHLTSTIGDNKWGEDAQVISEMSETYLSAATDNSIVPAATSTIKFENPREVYTFWARGSETTFPVDFAPLFRVRCAYRNPLSSHIKITYHLEGGHTLEGDETITSSEYTFAVAADGTATFSNIHLASDSGIKAPSDDLFLAGWMTSQNATEIKYYPNMSETLVLKPGEETEIHLYAAWRDYVETTKVTLNANGGHFKDGTTEKGIFLSGEHDIQTITANELKTSGNYIEKDGGKFYYKNFEFPKENSYYLVYNTNLTDNNYICIYNNTWEGIGNDTADCAKSTSGRIAGQVNKFTQTNGNKFSIGYWSFANEPEADFTFTIAKRRPQYGDLNQKPCLGNVCDEEIFLGWSTDPNANEPEYDIYNDFNDDTSAKPVSFIDEDVTLYATWGKLKLRYNNNYDDTIFVYDEYEFTGDAIEVNINTNTIPTRAHYTFLGYAASPKYTETPTYVYDESTSTFTPSTITIDDYTTLYAVWTPILTMQKVDEWKNQITVGEEFRVIDERDNKTYWVGKLADGNIWMTQNLDFDIDVNNVVPETSDVTTAWNASSIATPVATLDREHCAGTGHFSFGDGGSSNYVYSCDVGDIYWNSFPTKTIDSTTEVATEKSLHNSFGNLYEWGAATAGSTIKEGIATTSICPKGWHLPAVSGPNSFGNLLEVYNIENTDQLRNTLAYLTPSISPYAAAKGFDYSNSSGAYWTSETNGETEASALSNVFQEIHFTNSYRHGAKLVRCISYGK